MKVLVTLEALTPPCRDTFCRHAAPGAWPESARMREIRQKGIYTFIHSSFHESWDRFRRNKNKKNLGGKIEQSSDEEVQEESVSELLPGESNDETFPENFKPTCQERASPYMMKAVVNQLKYLQGKSTKKNKTKDLAKLKKPTIEWQRANSHHSTPPAVLYFLKPVYFLANENSLAHFGYFVANLSTFTCTFYRLKLCGGIPKMKNIRCGNGN